MSRHDPDLQPRFLSRTGSSTSATSLRPRTKRQTSDLDHVGEDQSPVETSVPLTPPLESPYHSRTASPIPSKHPSRPSSSNATRRRLGSPGGDPSGSNLLNPNYGNDLATSLSGLWGKSWTSLHSLASNYLGSDATGLTIKDKSPDRQRRSYETSSGKTRAWGPGGKENGQPGGGSKEERQAMIRARKRQELLTGAHSLHPSSTSYHKRRTSDDMESTSAPPGEHDDREALVYIHKITPEDTLPGISIRYNCQPAIIKKSNRMWSNDGIQVRKHLVIPVDSCAIRGRRVLGPSGGEEHGLIAQTPSQSDVSTPQSSQVLREDSDSTIKPKTAQKDLVNDNPISPRSSTTEVEPAWKHDHWMLLEGHTIATEIARISRRDLAYFPRTRRKSVSFSDLDSPPPSFEYSRPSIRVSDESDPPSTYHHKRRSSSEQFAKYMIGPGGVGSLRGKGESAPGPAEDKLTKVFGKLNPKAPRPGSQDQDGYDSLSASSSTVNLEQFGGALEGWVRKLAKQAAKAVEPLPSHTGHTRTRSTAIGVAAGSGDLIEMNNAFEIGDDEESDESSTDNFEDERGRARSTKTTGFYGDEQVLTQRPSASGKRSTEGNATMNHKKKGA